MMLRRTGGDFLGSCNTSIVLSSPDKGVSATGRCAAAGGTGETPERPDWAASGEGPHGNVLYIINNPCLCVYGQRQLAVVP